MSISLRSLGLLSLALSAGLAGCGGAAESHGSAGGASNLGGALTSGGATSGGGASMTSGGNGNASGGSTSGAGGMTANSSGGSGGASMTSGGNSSSGGASTHPDVCNLPWADSGCDAYFPKFWHNPETGLCEPRVYGGCGGNANQFNTFSDCVTACDDPRTHCDQAIDCELRSPSCCGTCEPISINDLIAVSHGTSRQVCNVACGACPAPQPNASTGRYFIPACIEHHCSVVDIRETPITECATNDDCVLRNTAGCCEACGASGDPIAYNKDTDIVQAFCGGVTVPCPACIGGVPQGYAAVCEKARCVVELQLGL